MPTKLSRYAEGVMEAAWLAAIVTAPLFFNKYSSRIFEPDKATLLRSLALIMLLAWSIKIFDQVMASRKRLSENITIKGLLKVPLVLPVASLMLAFFIATIFSVTPRISFWGSYQRLQGMYTTFAYLVLFATLIGNLKEKAQIERLITTAVLTSLPISLYGVLQHFGIDPIPWGGDVTRRVASHMGNPIFVAAFLIMVFPLTVGRIVESFGKILWETEGLGAHTARSTIYIFIASLQLIAIFFTQSRGPWLGLFSGGFFLFVLLSLYWRKRWMTISIVLIGILASAFLVVLNIPGGPLQSLHSNDSFRRLGQLLNPQSRTARVRALIWGGASEMVSPHEPIEYPDGDIDTFNFLRPLIGYGPESMHMAYNPFYPPALAYVEARNASPDRSHNETWDSLVFAGVFGLIAYLAVFTSVFYYALKWLNLITSKRQRLIFFTIYFGSGIVSAILFSSWQGIAFAGLGLPFGFILGLIIYLVLIAVFSKWGGSEESITSARSLTLIVLLSAVVAHFAEINFGISIVSTKTYFFLYAGLIVAVGYQLPKMGAYRTDENLPDTSKQKSGSSRRRKIKKSQQKDQDKSDWIRAVVLGGCITGLLILPMDFEYIANLRGLTSAPQIFWTSFTQLKENVISYGVLALILTTWLSAGVILSSEIAETSKDSPMWKSIVSILGISGLIGLFYGFWLSGSLARIARMVPQNIDEVIVQTAGLEGLLTQFFTFLVIGILIMGFYLPSNWPTRTRNDSFWGPIIAVSGFVFVIWLSVTTNLRIIHADIAFKMAEPFSGSRQWVVANTLYRRAIELSPSEDYYYLFLGRGSLEDAKTITDPIQQEDAFRKAEADLVQAQKINPLNPDHTANLARLYSWWALQAPDENSRGERGSISDEYYARVTVLSPNNARLWDEWAILQLNVLNNPDRAIELLNHSLDLDPKYDWTHALAGDYFSRLGVETEDEGERKDFLDQAVYHYEQAIEIEPKNTNYYFALASTYQSLNDVPNVIATLEVSLEYAGNNDVWKIEDNLTHYYLQLNDLENAILHAQRALTTAPEAERERLQTVVNQLQPTP
jgi:tetratricopeptide (TPR) repeat protein/O-antigen ligase